MSKAREHTPHPAGQLDQSKLARSRLLVADAFTRDRAATTKPDAHDSATWLLDQLQALGWRQPPDPAADMPPLRPATVAGEDSPGRRAFREARAQLAARRDTPTGTSDPDVSDARLDA